MKGRTLPIVGTEEKEIMTVIFAESDLEKLIVQGLSEKLPRLPKDEEPRPPGLYYSILGSGDINLVLIKE